MTEDKTPQVYCLFNLATKGSWRRLSSQFKLTPSPFKFMLEMRFQADSSPTIEQSRLSV